MDDGDSFTSPTGCTDEYDMCYDKPHIGYWFVKIKSHVSIDMCYAKLMRDVDNDGSAEVRLRWLVGK